MPVSVIILSEPGGGVPLPSSDEPENGECVKGAWSVKLNPNELFNVPILTPNFGMEQPLDIQL